MDWIEPWPQPRPGAVAELGPDSSRHRFVGEEAFQGHRTVPDATVAAMGGSPCSVRGLGSSPLHGSRVSTLLLLWKLRRSEVAKLVAQLHNYPGGYCTTCTGTKTAGTCIFVPCSRRFCDPCYPGMAYSLTTTHYLQPLSCEAHALLKAGRPLPGVIAAQHARTASAEHGPT